MGKTVGISDYWNTRLEQWVQAGIRRSKAEIVQQGLERIQSALDDEKAAWEDFKEERKKE